MFHRKKQYTMSKSEATATLQNVLNACDKPASNNMDEILSKTFQISGGYKIRIIVTAVLLFITIISPLLFSPKLSKSNYNSKKADVKIENYEVVDSDLYIDLAGPFLVVANAYAVNPDGEQFTPVEDNIWKDQIHFDNYDDTEWNIYLNDVNGNTIHLLLTPTD